jgi:peptidoglycan hydrolase-like protein with peptidoglycan-binding domain
VPRSNYFGPETVAAVERFQEFYGLAVTGIVDNETWQTISRIYTETVASLPSGYEGTNAKLYPGFFLTEGMRGENVQDLQTYLNKISQNIPEVPSVSVTGYFGEQTENAVREFQRLFGIEVSGAVGPVTWATIAQQYDFFNNQT